MNPYVHHLLLTAGSYSCLLFLSCILPCYPSPEREEDDLQVVPLLKVHDPNTGPRGHFSYFNECAGDCDAAYAELLDSQVLAGTSSVAGLI